MPLSDTDLSKRIREIYEPLVRDSFSAPSIRFEQFASKKEEKVSSSINLVLSAEGLTTFIKDLQELAETTKYKRDNNGDRVYNDETCSYEVVEVPLEERWVNLGDIKWNGEKFVVKTNNSVLNNMEALNARRNRVKSYETA